MKHHTLYHTILSLGLILISSTLSTHSIASPLPYQSKNQEEGKDRRHREPPPQAYEACKGKKLNDNVEVTTPRGDKIKAQCIESPKGLFARPERPPHRDEGDDQERRPPEKRR